MTVDEAIKTAIDYEIKVRDVYAESYKKIQNPEGKRVMKAMTREEQEHVDYLKKRLKEWQETGTITAETLKTAIPSSTTINESLEKLRAHTRPAPKNTVRMETELNILRKALQVERETSDFYKKMVGELSDEVQDMFARFLEIEEGHLDIVQAEINSVSGMGFWFDFQEFKLG